MRLCCRIWHLYLLIFRMLAPLHPRIYQMLGVCILADRLCIFFIGRFINCRAFAGDVATNATSRESSPIYCAFKRLISKSLVNRHIIHSDYAHIDVTAGIETDRQDSPQKYLVSQPTCRFINPCQNVLEYYR